MHDQHGYRAPLRDERGASSVEYGLVLTGIAAIIAGIIFAFGDNVTSLFDDTCDSVATQRGAAECVGE